MSTPIWDSGDLVACIAAVRCDRCNVMGSCVQLSTHGDQINICNKRCFLELCYEVGKVAGDTLRQVMGRGLRGEGIGQLMTEPERDFLNRTWCDVCKSHFCSCVKP